MKKKGEKIAALTAYDFVMASIFDETGIDLVLVGDSAAMVFSGHETTLPFTMDEAIYHCKAVRRGITRPLLVGDMPFLSYHVGAEDAIRNAGRFFKEASVDAVKLEGGVDVAELIKKIVQAGMPVMGHVGMQPQSVHRFGGYKVRGKKTKDADKVLADALAVQEAGAFAVVLEKVTVETAKKITEQLNIPTIGIGAGPHCDGQILVAHDMLGLYEKFVPKFVRRYARLADEIRKACANYCVDVKKVKFPNSDESFS